MKNRINIIEYWWRKHIIEPKKIGDEPKLNAVNLLPKKDLNPFKVIDEKETR